MCLGVLECMYEYVLVYVHILECVSNVSVSSCLSIFVFMCVRDCVCVVCLSF